MSGKRSSRRRAHYLVRRVINFLRDNEEGYRIRLQPLKGNKKLCIKKYKMRMTTLCGLVDDIACFIVVDFRKNLIGIIVHEVLHILYPDATERQIMTMQNLIMRHMTEKQAIEIWIYAAQCMRVT